jgi:hypothetical protein
MIHEHHAPVAEETSVRLPEVKPWVRFPVCPKCGGSLGAGIWLLALWRSSRGESAQSYVYCKGDCNSTVQVPGLNVQTGQMGPLELKVPCFGIFSEHIHVECGRCHFAWLMACKGERKR